MFDITSIARFIKKHVTFFDVLLVAALCALYFISRTLRLDSFPIFTDEGIYIRWAKVAQADPAWRFISLTDGKQPLHTWGMIPFLKLFSTNLLLGGRSFSVLSGFIAMCGMFATATFLYRRKYAGYIAAFLYVITPMFLFYDRLALADSAVNAGALWVLFGSLVLIHTLRLDVALLLGLGGGLALLTKSSSQMFLGLAGLAPIMLFCKKIDHLFTKKAATYYVLLIISIILAFVLYNVQRLSPFLYLVAEKNKTFVLTPSELLRDPFALFWGNVHLIPWYVSAEMGYVLAGLGVMGIALFFKRSWQQALYLTLWIILPYLAITAIAKVLFPRYVIYLASFLVLGATYWFMSAKRLWLTLSLTAVFASVWYMNYTIIFDQAKIPFPPVDRGQYIESFNSGWGVKDIIQYARNRATPEKPVKILAEGNFGVIGDMLESSINRDDENIAVSGYWPLGEEELRKEQVALKDHTVLVVFSHKQSPEDIPGIWPIKFIKAYTKPGGNDPFLLYELTR